MFAKQVLDSQGREWTIEKRWTLWHRIVRPVDLTTQSYPHRRLVCPETQLTGPSPDEPSGLGSKVAAVALTPLLVIESIGTLLSLVFVMFPLAVFEMALLVITGFCLWIARTTRLARQRVDVTCWTGHHLHSETVLLVHGRRRAQQLVEKLAADRFAAQRPFRPNKLPGVTVRSHRSIWQAPDKWVPSVTNPYGSGGDHIRRTQLVTLVAGTCVVLLVAWMLAYPPGG